MDENLRKILEELGIQDEGEYYFDNEGRIYQRSIPVDRYVGVYKSKDGNYYKDGFLFDEFIGLKQNDKGEFKKEGFLVDEDTGIYEDNEGNFVKKSILSDEKTDYYKDNQGNLKKKEFLVDSSRINTSKPRRDNTSPKSIEEWLFQIGAKLVVILVGIYAAVWILGNIVIPLTLINISLISFIAGIIYKKRSTLFFILTVVGLFYILLDYNSLWFTASLPATVSLFKGTIPYFLYINIITGLIGGYFLIRNILNEKYPDTNSDGEFTKRNLILMSALFLVGLLTIGIQKYSGSGGTFSFFSNRNDSSIKDSKQESSTSIEKKVENMSSLSEEKLSSNENSSWSNVTYAYSEIISNTLKLDDARNISALSAQFSTDIKKFWSLDNPDIEQVKKEIKSRWNRQLNSLNKMLEVRELDSNTFEIDNQYSYTDKRSGENKTLFSTITVRFDSSGKINYIDGIQQK